MAGIVFFPTFRRATGGFPFDRTELSAVLLVVFFCFTLVSEVGCMASEVGCMVSEVGYMVSEVGCRFCVLPMVAAVCNCSESLSKEM